MTSIVGSIIEAWGEIKTHRARFVVSLIGIFLAVFALTVVQGVGAIGIELIKKETDKFEGKSATVSFSVNREDTSQSSAQEILADLQTLRDTLKPSHASFVGGLREQFQVASSDSTSSIGNFKAVEPQYLDIHPTTMLAGRWFTPSDSEQLATQLVLSKHVAEGVGLTTDSPLPATVTLYQGNKEHTASVIGIVPGSQWEREAYLPYSQAYDKMTSIMGYSQLEIWMPPEDVAQLKEMYDQTTTASGGTLGMQVPYGNDEMYLIFTIITWSIRILGLFALALASLGVVNVAIVTVRARIREIGVRRSFGATSRRVFAAILLESTLASFLAGVVGVLAAVALLRSPWPVLLEAYNPSLAMDYIPPFPVGVALEGLFMATLVGAAAGLIPATMAVRAKVIEAIRF